MRLPLGFVRAFINRRFFSFSKGTVFEHFSNRGKKKKEKKRNYKT